MPGLLRVQSTSGPRGRSVVGGVGVVGLVTALAASPAAAAPSSNVRAPKDPEPTHEWWNEETAPEATAPAAPRALVESAVELGSGPSLFFPAAHSLGEGAVLNDSATGALSVRLGYLFCRAGAPSLVAGSGLKREARPCVWAFELALEHARMFETQIETEVEGAAVAEPGRYWHLDGAGHFPIVGPRLWLVTGLGLGSFAQSFGFGAALGARFYTARYLALQLDLQSFVLTHSGDAPTGPTTCYSVSSGSASSTSCSAPTESFVDGFTNGISLRATFRL